MSADAIAHVIADLRDNRFRLPPLVQNGPAGDGSEEALQLAREVAAEATIIDCTAVADSLYGGSRDLFDDHPCIAPPWTYAAFCFVANNGEIYVMSTIATEHEPELEQDDIRGHSWKSTRITDWSTVKWTTHTFVWVGGPGAPPYGPVCGLQSAIAADGGPLDFHWISLEDRIDPQAWELPQAVLLGSLNLLACNNVEAMEPCRPRAQRRRLERLGVRVNTIHVFPAGSKRRSVGAAQEFGAGVAAHAVRGHFAHYGREMADGSHSGLLFGKYAGRFWIPSHARGSSQHGEVRSTYELHPVSAGDRA